MTYREGKLSIIGVVVAVVVVVAVAAVPATSQIYTDIYDFDGVHGGQPNNPEILSQGRDGNLYGTAPENGASEGVAFRITPSGRLDVIYNFGGVNGDIEPESGLTLGTDGNFYGTTLWGTIFKISAAGNFTRLRTSYDVLYAPPIQGADGNLYGVTWDVNSAGDAGVAYRMTPTGVYTVLTPLPGKTRAPLIQGTDGKFYGTTDQSLSSHGTVYKMTSTGTLTVLYEFDGPHGSGPVAPLMEGSDGAIYGTTHWGGTHCSPYGCGTVFKVIRKGVIKVLHNFGDPNYPNDGAYADGGLVQATDGNIYGTTFYGGANGYGVIFRITPDGTYSVLHDFDAIYGADPANTPVQHTNGKIYGMTLYGGHYANWFGSIYSLDVGLGPFVRLQSATGRVGTIIKILGQGFTGASAVSFNGTPSVFKVWADTFLSATVPDGVTTGFVTVTTPGGVLTSNQVFRVKPVILSVSPTSGAPGSAVVITGTSVAETKTVAFTGGSVPAVFTVNSDTQVTVTVPPAASSGHIVLTTTGGNVRSPDIFMVTP